MEVLDSDTGIQSLLQGEQTRRDFHYWVKAGVLQSVALLDAAG